MKVVMQNGKGEIVEKKSRFIAHVFKIETEDEAIEIINKIKKKYWDARHNCYAYVLGDKGEIQRFSDDGEPSGTAGKPIFDVITGRQITNCLIVVTRYFGGVLLGTGGLVRAYQSSSIEGINNSIIGEVIEGFTGNIDIEYTNLGKVQYICESMGIEIQDIQYTENVHMELIIEKDIMEKFVKTLQNEFSGDVNMTNTASKKICKKI